ncbi:MAG TPA: cyclodeaminase/cyclohydrolase family protein [Terrimesophilobacter sp.]|nr:cyclodeaminase/cyclohydrolase family protein [Terrimesophilobacter sp.]
MGGSGWAAGDYLDRPLRELLEDVAGTDPVPAAGSLVAVLGALAAGLAAKVARRSTAQRPDAEDIAERADLLRQRLEPIITGDAASYAEALTAGGSPADRRAAMVEASSGPVVVAETAAEIAEIASSLAADCNPNLRVDAAAVAWLAASVAEVGADLTAANIGESEALQDARAAAARARAAADLARG